MTYPDLPEVAEVASHFCRALENSPRNDTPYRHWLLTDILPEKICTGLITLPIAPPVLGDTKGVRDTFNSLRTFLTPSLRARFPVCSVLSDALQRPDVARQLEKTLEIEASGGFLRMEYMQDTDGAWLEPHRDIKEKLFSMVIYLFTGPDAKDWGTDIYDADRKWVGRSSGEFNTGAVFIAGENTWHGFDPRPINGVRRLMEINYVRGWRDSYQLCFPDWPISTKGA